MLSSDQRAIDGLLFARRIAARLRSRRIPSRSSPKLAASSSRRVLSAWAAQRCPRSAPAAPGSRRACLRARSRRPRSTSGSAGLGVTVNRALSGRRAMPLLGRPKTTCCSQFHTVWMPKTPHNWSSSTRTLYSAVATPNRTRLTSGQRAEARVRRVQQAERETRDEHCPAQTPVAAQVFEDVAAEQDLFGGALDGKPEQPADKHQRRAQPGRGWWSRSAPSSSVYQTSDGEAHHQRADRAPRSQRAPGQLALQAELADGSPVDEPPDAAAPRQKRRAFGESQADQRARCGCSRRRPTSTARPARSDKRRWRRRLARRPAAPPAACAPRSVGEDADRATAGGASCAESGASCVSTNVRAIGAECRVVAQVLARAQSEPKLFEKRDQVPRGIHVH